MRCSCLWRCSFTFCSTCRCHSMRSALNSKKCNRSRRLCIGHQFSCLTQSFIRFSRILCLHFIYGLIRITSLIQKNMVSVSVLPSHCSNINLSGESFQLCSLPFTCYTDWHIYPLFIWLAKCSARCPVFIRF